MFTIVGIDHIVLRTNKLQAMIAFYCNILGCKIERQTSVDTGLTQLRAGTALIDLVTVESQLGRAGGGEPSLSNNNLDHFCLQLERISEQEIISHLQSHDIETGDFNSRYGAQGFANSLYIKDPQGNTVELRSVL